MRVLLLIYIVLVVSGCATTFNTANFDQKSGQFITDSKNENLRVVVSEEVDIKPHEYFAVVFVENYKILPHAKRYGIFVKESVEKFNYFKYVQSIDELELSLLKKDKLKEVDDLDSLANINKVSDIIDEKFLIIRPEITKKEGYNYESTLEVIDPKTGLLFQVNNTAFNWSGLDQNLFYPMLNEMAAWLKK